MLMLLEEQRKKIANIASGSIISTDDKVERYNALINFIEENYIDYSIYTPATLRKAMHTSNDNELLAAVQYFSGGYSKLFDVKYCYYLENDPIDIARDEFFNYLNKKIEPVDINGSEIDDFDPDNLSFYCVISDE